MSDNAYKTIIAKSGSDTSHWLPLYVHLLDTAGVMCYLLNRFVSPSIAEACDMEQSVLFVTAMFLAAVHDIGKAAVGFQYKITRAVAERLSALEHCGIFIPDAMDMGSVRDMPHALVGEIILNYFGCPETVSAIVGAHHGVPAQKGEVQDLNCERKEIKRYRNFFGDNEDGRETIENCWKAIIGLALERAGLDSLEELPQKLTVQAQMVLSGLLITADWIASNAELFPLISVDSVGDDIDFNNRIDAALEKLEFPEMWKPERQSYSDKAFEDTFRFAPSDVQRCMLDIVKETNAPGLFILEAPMGCGKTEAALSSAELLAAKCGKNGLFFGMPTQATASGIFPRVMSWAEKQSQEYYHSILLRHGSAELNIPFQRIQRGIPEEESDSGLFVHSWFCESKKACLADFVVATVDHMLMMALKRRHVMLLHLGLSEKVVVIDEVHAYDAYMSRYLERALQWLGAYHTPVILLSATLPAARRMSLVRAYSGAKTSDEALEKNTAYPLLTWTDSGEIHQQPLPYTGEHRNVRIIKCTGDDVPELIRSTVEQGGCVGIIMNTVSRAQSVAEMVRRDITDNVLLYHAQFIMTDRADKEDQLLKSIGKDSDIDTRRGYVVVGTQVLEQSLDIDLDLLITDICPMDLLLQRIGRLHRHSHHSRPDGLKEPQCYVVTDELEGEKSGSKFIYTTWLLEETLKQLPESIDLPEDISPLVQKVYSAFDNSEKYKKYISKDELKESKAGAFLLKKPKKDIHNLLERAVSDSNSSAEASVRDGLSSVEVLVLRQFDDGTIGFLDGTRLSDRPTKEETVRLLGQRLRLPARFSEKWSIDRTIDELEKKGRTYTALWKKNYLLAGQLLLLLNGDNETELSGLTLKYDFNNGLTYTKRSDDIE
ncbi:MAG: CRISPR-associated helicase Cas3' [Ruminococcus sp.]|nr:CRISPR-associated helicase Cas3' [Ruminococcus sp.]